MKKLFKTLTLGLVLGLVVACSGNSNTSSDDKKLKVAATLEPHATILEQAKLILKEKYGIELEIEVLDDYFIFNKALENNETDANFFQHVPFLEEEIKNNNYNLVSVGGVHLEPFGFYSKTITKLDELKEGSKIVISNSAAESGRILSILDEAGLIKLDTSVDKQKATLKNIVENKKNLVFEEIKPELLVQAYQNKSGDLIGINGNYAIQAGLSPKKNAVILENSSETNPYVNIVVVKKGNENTEKIKNLISVLQSDEIQKFITTKYSDGSVIPVSK